MSEEYLKYGKQTVFGDLSKDGLLFRFLSEYNVIFGEKKHNLSCSTCREKLWNDYLNLFKMELYFYTSANLFNIHAHNVNNVF